MSNGRMPALLATVALLACHGDLTPPPAAEAGPTTEFRVTVMFVGFGPAPWSDRHVLYSWTGGGASRVTVSRVSNSQDVVWELVASSGYGIRAPVTHGYVPHGATATVSADPYLLLSTGDTYRVRVTLVSDGRTATAEFTT